MINAHVNTQKVAQNFAKAHATYGKSAIVQHQMCHTLINLLMANLPDIRPKSVLEIGCGVGNLTDIYTSIWTLDALYLNDLYDVGIAGANLIIGDIERLDLPKVDMVLSSSALQWIKDLPNLFKRIYHTLPKGGVFAFASFGGQNLSQIKALTGMGLDYYGMSDIKAMLGVVGFDVIATDQHQETLYFTHPKDILRHIKDTGVAVGGRAWTRSSLVAFCDGYDSFATDKGYPLTYDTLFVVAIKP
ncbi:MAG: methyltransferase domain-containing protein [Moraxella sp.]|nr:methyltransferase domain-containing protein [Moraxella sp.]